MIIYFCSVFLRAAVAELADALDSKSSAFAGVPVRLRPAAPNMDMLPVERLFGLPTPKYFADEMQKKQVLML